MIGSPYANRGCLRGLPQYPIGAALFFTPLLASPCASVTVRGSIAVGSGSREEPALGIALEFSDRNYDQSSQSTVCIIGSENHTFA